MMGAFYLADDTSFIFKKNLTFGEIGFAGTELMRLDNNTEILLINTATPWQLGVVGTSGTIAVALFRTTSFAH